MFRQGPRYSKDVSEAPPDTAMKKRRSGAFFEGKKWCLPHMETACLKEKHDGEPNSTNFQFCVILLALPWDFGARGWEVIQS